MTIQLKNNGKSKYAMTILFTVGYIIIICLGVLFNGDVFSVVFPALTIIETLIVKSLFEKVDTNKGEIN